MTVTAPPRPPRPSDPVDREELEALVEALIEEARQRARRRRRMYAAVLVGVARQSPWSSSLGGPRSRSGPLPRAGRTIRCCAGAPNSKIAFAS